MKKKGPELSQRYPAALRARLGRLRPSGAAAARRLGSEVMSADFGTLNLARMYERALSALAASYDFSTTRNGLIRRAGTFFKAALIPLEQDHRATRDSLQHLRQRAETQRLHSAALARGNRQLKREIVRRKAGEAAVKRGRERYHLLFTQSLFTQIKLHCLARQLLSVQEDERRKISRELHDEVVQTQSSKTNRRLRLLGMRERVEMVGGALTIASAPGLGTTVRAEIPFSPGGAA